MSNGIHQVPNAQKTKESPSTICAVAWRTARAAGRGHDVGARQHGDPGRAHEDPVGGPRVAGVTGTVSQCSMMSDTSTRYSISPTPHAPQPDRDRGEECRLRRPYAGQS